MANLSKWTAYHGIRDREIDPETFAFRGLSEAPEGIHLGSLAQAKMRAGRGSVIEVTVHGDRLSQSQFKRMKDRPGNWRDTNKRAARGGAAALVYLNRYEGVTNAALEEIMKIESDKFDRMSDAKVRKLVPQLEDSWVILDPEIITVERVLRPYQVTDMLLDTAAEPSRDPQP